MQAFPDPDYDTEDHLESVDDSTISRTFHEATTRRLRGPFRRHRGRPGLLTRTWVSARQSSHDGDRNSRFDLAESSEVASKRMRRSSVAIGERNVQSRSCSTPESWTVRGDCESLVSPGTALYPQPLPLDSAQSAIATLPSALQDDVTAAAGADLNAGIIFDDGASMNAVAADSYHNGVVLASEFHAGRGSGCEWNLQAEQTSGRTTVYKEAQASATARTKRATPSPWDDESVRLLRAAVKKYGTTDWKAVATMVPGRTNGQCRQKWFYGLRPQVRAGQWAKEEDQVLIQLVANHERQPNFLQLSKTLLQGRSAKSIRERWENQFDPAISRDEFSVEEDRAIREMRARGVGWAQMANVLINRTSSQVRSRFRVLDRRDRRRLRQLAKIT